MTGYLYIKVINGVIYFCTLDSTRSNVTTYSTAPYVDTEDLHKQLLIVLQTKHRLYTNLNVYMIDKFLKCVKILTELMSELCVSLDCVLEFHNTRSVQEIEVLDD
jgi:hypothetical protein